MFHETYKVVQRDNSHLGAHNYILFVRFCIGFACFEDRDYLFNLYVNGRLLFSSDVCYIFLVFITAKLLDCANNDLFIPTYVYPRSISNNQIIQLVDHI